MSGLLGSEIPSNVLRDTRTATIANGASLSGAIDLGGYRVAAIDMPSAWTAASLTFQVSQGGGTYLDLYDDAGVEVTCPAAASRSVVPGATLALQLLGHRYIKVRSGTSGAAVNQGAARDLSLVLIPA